MNLELKKRIITSIFLISLLLLMYFYSFILVIGLIIITIITWVEFFALISKIFRKESIVNRFIRLILKSVSLVYLSLLVYSILAIESNYPELKVFIIYSICISIASDIGGLIVGKTLKGKKLTKISPKKTVSGSIGSFIFSLTLMVFFFNYFNYFDYFQFVQLSIITILISLTSQLGDLFISFLKRKANVKDTSNILPGHGGFLDRIDGIIFAIPIGLLLFIFI